MRSDFSGIPPARVNQQLGSSIIAGVVCQIFGAKCQKADPHAGYLSSQRTRSTTRGLQISSARSPSDFVAKPSLPQA
jgi:hypothetical protein